MLNQKKNCFVCNILLAITLGCNSPQSKKEENSTPADTLTTENKDTVPLPEPYATKSSINFSNVKEWPQGQKPAAPAGFTVTKFADMLRNSRWIYVGPNDDIFVAESSTKTGDIKDKVKDVISGKNKSENTECSANRISLFRDANHNEDEDEVYGRPAGVTFTSEGSLLVADDAGNTLWKVTASK
ncbi:MAG: hypothetical protein ABIN89_28195 [Chitinophagaceae bacterium]